MGSGYVEREREREREREGSVNCREREGKMKEGKVGKKASDVVKTDQYLRRQMSSQLAITNDLNDIVFFMNQLFANISSRITI